MACNSCKRQKEETELERLVKQLPPVTAEGKMTFACILNNKEAFVVTGAYEAPGMGIYSNCKGGSDIHRQNKSTEIYATICPNGNKRFYITIKDSLHAGTFSLGHQSGNIFRIEQELASSNGNGAMLVFENDSIGQGSINFIRADSIYAGTFNAKLYNGKDGPEMNITEGRFDLKME